MRHISLTIMAGALVALSSPTLAALQCDWLAGGTYRADAAAAPQTRALAYGQWFCDQGFDTADAARNFGGDRPAEKWFAALADTIQAERGAWRTAYTDFCAGYSGSDQAQAQLVEAERPVGPRLDAALDACTQEPGLHAWIERTADPALFTWRTRYLAAEGESTSAQIDVVPSNARCAFPNQSGADGTATVCRRYPDFETSIGLRSRRPILSGDVAILPAVTKGAIESSGYTIAGESLNYTLPSGWLPSAIQIWQTSFGSANLPTGVNLQASTPPLVCVSGDHVYTDTSECGYQGSPSPGYGLGSGSQPTIGISVVVPVPYSAFHYFYLYFYMGSGDDSCDAFANSGKQGQPPTRWWEYKVDSPPGQNMLFSADLSFATNSSEGNAYYAVLTNCSLSAPSQRTAERRR